MDAGEKKKRMPMKNAGDEREFAKEVTKKKIKMNILEKRKEYWRKKKMIRKFKKGRTKKRKSLYKMGLSQCIRLC